MTLIRRIGLTLFVAMLAVVGAAGYLAVRDSSFVKVRHVTIAGVTGEDAPAMRRALRRAALGMTTLHVRADELERSVASFAIVRSVSASADFPSRLDIEVHQYEPVAYLATGDGRRVAVAQDGTLLAGTASRRRLPVVEPDARSAEDALRDVAAMRLVAVLAPAPDRLRPLLLRAYYAKGGVRVSLREGPVLRFGPARRVRAKWAAAARVLSDRTARGAAFIDLRLPERPAAGGFGSAPAGAEEAPEGSAQPYAENTQP